MKLPLILPLVLSCAEVSRLLGAVGNIKNPVALFETTRPTPLKATQCRTDPALSQTQP